jgi:hypothetical protein
MSYRRMWPIIVSGFFEPLFYLLSLGFGLGGYVGDVVIDGTPIDYATFVAPGLLAASAMNGAFYDATNVFWKLKYQKLYDAILSTPLGPKDIAAGEAVWALFRGLLYAIGFFTVIVALGLVHSWWALLALPATVFVGFAFAQLAGLRHPQPRDPADVPLLRHVLPALDLPGLARGRDQGDAAVPRCRPPALADDGHGRYRSAGQRRLPDGARPGRHLDREQACREAAAHVATT